ncbi:MAG: DUF1761 family protein [Leptospiraceae bacterium]|nr:DUF1761 family protein [Leptospiraceae bacterium]MDW8305837.1 DUF1761 family protein [Leptospiraceae bacterium]
MKRYFVFAINAILQQALAFLYYREWLHYYPHLAQELKRLAALETENLLPYALSTLFSFLLSLGLYHLLQLLRVQNLMKAVRVGLWAYLIILSPALIIHYLFLGISWLILIVDLMRELLHFVGSSAIVYIFSRER